MDRQPDNALIWGDKRYYSLNYYLREKFGEKVVKISLDAGFTCPNRDGRLARGGCAFCSARGSGDFVAAHQSSLAEQYRQGREIMQKKWPADKFIAHLQAFSNTYAPAARLREIYSEVLELPGVVGMAIATRPDCLPPEVLDFLEEFNQKTFLWVELGLQTIHAQSAGSMNLQYNYQDFQDALQALSQRNIACCAHMILGLPGEKQEDMLDTAKALAKLPVQGIKIHLLHLMKNTPLAERYAVEPFPFLSLEEYIQLVADILEILPPTMVIHRLTGDSPRSLIIGPTWSLHKKNVLNGIDRELRRRDSWQSKFFRDFW